MHSSILFVLDALQTWLTKASHSFSPAHKCRRDSGILFKTCADRRWRPAKLRGRSVSSALPCISFRRQPPQLTQLHRKPERGAKGTAGTFQRGNLRTALHPETRFSKASLRKSSRTQPQKTHSVQQAWMNSRNPFTIASARKHRQPVFLHPTVETGSGHSFAASAC
jgi:hypothetical protein